MNTQQLYGLIRDCGDGSSALDWYRDREKVEEKLDLEEYYANEGSPAAQLTLPADLDLAAAGFRVRD